MEKIFLIILICCFTGCTKKIMVDDTIESCSNIMVDYPSNDTLKIPFITSDELNFVIEQKIGYYDLKKLFKNPAMTEKKIDSLIVWYGLSHSMGKERENENNMMFVQPTNWVRIVYNENFEFIESTIKNTSEFIIPKNNIVTTHNYKNEKKCQQKIIKVENEVLDETNTFLLIMSGFISIATILWLILN